MEELLSTEGFVPRALCGQWSRILIVASVGGNVLIALAYFAIPVVVLYLHRRLPHSQLLYWTALFILACGVTHVLDALMFVWPAYRLLSFVLLVTGLISWRAAYLLALALPKLLQYRPPEVVEHLEAQVAIKTHELESQTAVVARLTKLLEATKR